MTPSHITSSSPAAKHNAITSLARIYVEAGLPFPAAFKAALADYTTFEGDDEPDQSLRAA